MAWTLHLLVWTTVLTASAYKCKHTAYTSSDSEFRRQYDDFVNQEQLEIPNNHGYDRMNTRSADISPASYSSNVPDDAKSAQLRLATQTRTESQSKVLSRKTYTESRRGQNNDKIVFPGPTSTRSEEFELEIPDHCKGIGICEDVPNYPKEQAKKLISELTDLGMFPDDKLDVPEVPDVPDIAQRVGPIEENIELCQFLEKTVYPKAAVDSSGKWHVVLNQDDNPVQGFKVEICKHEIIIDEKTSELKIREGEWQDLANCSKVATFAPGYQGRCKQKYVYRKMAVLAADGSKLEKSLKVPSCCSCVARLL
ncbi:hypothetical protein PYW07_001491 [Mythimna separata]|uniref:Spaetzle domain-containing protein n=1 Tax=Mythimna separata TaxID=271217 RepID=A0AAD7YV42_MYTSE|nr:hypothetical protein PYW07_001491 [Mythimna separata]